jgi:hypothetical protein
MVIESLSERMSEITIAGCSAEREEYHHNMMRLEACRLLELLGGQEDKLQEEELRKNIRSFAKTASGVVEALRGELKFADEIYKKAKGTKR